MKYLIPSILLITFLIGIIILIIPEKQEPKRIVTVGIIPRSIVGETWLSFERDKNVTVDRFMNYLPMHFRDIAIKRLRTFLYNESITHTPEIALEFGGGPTWGGIDPTPLKNITEGHYDVVLYDFANELKTYDDKYHKIVYIRPLTEFYGDWNPWGIYNKNNSREDFLPAYKHIVDILRSTGNKNLRFQLNIGGLSNINNANRSWGRMKYGNEPYSKYYPGDDYVDEFSIDVYNLAIWTGWTSFHDLTTLDYDELAAISDTPAINIGETGSSNYGGNKSQWILDTFHSVLCDFPRMTNIDFFFNTGSTNYTEKSTPSLIYPEEQEAFRQGIAMVKKYNAGDRTMCETK